MKLTAVCILSVNLGLAGCATRPPLEGHTPDTAAADPGPAYGGPACIETGTHIGEFAGSPCHVIPLDNGPPAPAEPPAPVARDKPTFCERYCFWLQTALTVGFAAYFWHQMDSSGWPAGSGDGSGTPTQVNCNLLFGAGYYWDSATQTCKKQGYGVGSAAHHGRNFSLSFRIAR